MDSFVDYRTAVAWHEERIRAADRWRLAHAVEDKAPRAKFAVRLRRKPRAAQQP